MTKKATRRLVVCFYDEGDELVIEPGPGVSTTEMNKAIEAFVVWSLENGSIQIQPTDGTLAGVAN